MQQETMTVREAELLSDGSFHTVADAASALHTIRGVSARGGKPAPIKPKSANNTSIDNEPQNTTSADDRAVARELEVHVGTPVQIQRSPRDVRLTFVFHSPEKLQEFLEVFTK
jgi:hypothetical protein